MPLVMDVRCPKCGGQIRFENHPTIYNRVKGFCDCNNGPVIELTLDGPVPDPAVGLADEQQGDETK